ncbi:MAG: hypothetical protein AAF351_03350 [Pseudomonadota bacterium]
MILRRIANAIRKMDWVVVTIELLVVIVGIYLGLQVDDWSKDRDQRADIERQLDRIRTDAIVLQDSLDQIIADIDNDLSRFQFAFEVLDGRDLTSDDELQRFEFAVVDSYRIENVSVEIPGLELLVESGDVRAIGDPELEAALLDFVNFRRRQSNVVESVSDSFQRQATVIMGSTGFAIDRLEPDKPWGARTRLVYELAELRGSTDFRRSFGNLAQLRVYLRLQLFGYREHIEDVILALESRDTAA